MRLVDFSSWQGPLLTLIGLALFTLISMGIRLLMIFSIQQRRERVNRQINERLRTFIAAYKTLGGSFTGELTIDPAHFGELRRRDQAKTEGPGPADGIAVNSDRARRIRDAVEAWAPGLVL